MKIIQSFAAIAGLIGMASCQQSGNGMAKYTVASADPRTCLAWIEKYMKASEDGSDCTNGECECDVKQGRAAIHQGYMPGMGFGFHAIDCANHPTKEGEGLADVAAKVETQVGDQSVYDPLMDNHPTFWLWNIDKLIFDLEKDDASMFKYQFESYGKTYYSVVTHVCEWTWVEFVSSFTGSQDPSSFTKTEVERMVFKDWNEPGNSYLYADYDTPISLSRAVTDFDGVKEFYGDIMGGTVIQEVAYEEDGSEWLTMQLPDALTHIQFVKRPTKANSTFTVQDFIDVHNDAHDEYIVDELCGFDQWADDHWAYDPTSGQTADAIVESLKEKGYTYKLFDQGMFTQVYAQDPTGWSLQLDMTYNNPPANVPSYSADCKINSSCTGQGYCPSNEEDIDLEFLIAQQINALQ